jgi:hypothetical protein
MRNDVFWDVVGCLAINDVSGEFVTSIYVGVVYFSLLVTTNAVYSLLIHSTLQLEVTRSSETSIITRPTWSHIPNDEILHNG